MCYLARILRASILIHQLAYPADLGECSSFSRLAEDFRQARAFLCRRFLNGMNQHQRPLAFPDIPVNLLAVTLVSYKVEQIILDLECGAEKKSVAHERIQIHRVAASDQCADADRINRSQPTGFLEDHLQVVRMADFGRFVSTPSQFHGLPLRPFASHSLSLLDNSKCKPFADLGPILEQWL